MTESQLIAYFMDIVSEIKRIGYHGVFLHFDNLELLSFRDLENCQQLFEEIRDIMQLPDVYYIFVARTGFFSQAIGSSERVSSIMGWPINIPPLTCEEVIETINIRYKLLSIDPGSEIKPVTDEFVSRIYKFYRGKIRFIRDAIDQITQNYSFTRKKTLKAKQAEELLVNIIQQKTKCLTYSEYKTLVAAVELDEFTNADLARLTDMKTSNISQILKRLASHNFITPVRQDGKKIYYRSREELRVLIDFRKVNKTNKVKQHIGFSLSKKQARLEKMMRHITKHKKITTAEYQNKAKISTVTARRDLQELVQEKKLSKEGRGKATFYAYIE